MNRMVRLALFGACLVCTWSLAQAATVPITVFPNPAQFGTVPTNSTSFLTVFVNNNTANPVNVSGMTFSGTNSTYFGFSGPSCVGIIAGGQFCQMDLSVTPTAMGTFSANLVIGVSGFGSPITIPLQGTGGNPLPTVTSVSPASIYTGNPATTITVTGTGFIPSSLIYLQNSSTALPTTYVSGTQIKAQVPASVLVGTGTVGLEVSNPQPAGGTVFFTVNVVALEPNLSSVSPSAVVAGTNPGPIVLSGGNFMNGATVQWNGKSIPTTYINSTQLQIQPAPGKLAAAQIVRLAVTNPSPGGVSLPIEFNVTYPAKITVLNLPANNLVWDPFAQRLYAALPSSYGPNGNSIAVIDPTTGVVNGYHFVGSEPTALGLSANAHYLYVGLNGNGSVQRMILPNFTPGFELSLGTTPNGAINIASDIKVDPADSNTFAVALGSTACCGGGPLEFFKNKTALTDTVSFPTITQLIFVNGTTLYGYSNGTVAQVAVSATGGTLTQQWNGLVTGDEIQYAGGLIYDSSGQVLDPATGTLTGTYDLSVGCCNSSTQILPDQAIDHVFALGPTPFFNSLGITAFNLADFTPIAAANLMELENDTSTPVFLQWGSSGFAFILQPGCCNNQVSPQVVLVQSPAMFSNGGPNPVPSASTLIPASVHHGGQNLVITIDGAGFVPASVVTWNGTTVSSNYLSPTQLKIYVPAADITTAGTATIVVMNPKPAGGTSSSLSFSID